MPYWQKKLSILLAFRAKTDTSVTGERKMAHAANAGELHLGGYMQK